ncbi:hypothetical protein EV137_6145 [Kribbella pratensis]|uniref:Glycosyl hydrolase family 98 putative carbohydrate-binding module domain-containing protein n=1 Tax=Kribbella pratensis TaxID=2512112 RepID=A0ABY2FBS2_9ACTN|nr:hypothetical protein [Kribbella pratensis]TDW88055.1 hypothetical protein EV137_6145 [Kribbella pratensis]
MRRVLIGLLTLLMLGSAAPSSVAASGAASGSASVRTAKIYSIRTTDATKGVITVVGTLSPAPAAGTRIPLHQWIPSLKRWQEVAHGYSSGSSVTITTVQPGSIRTYRIAVGPQAPYAAAISPMISFKHYVWRGMFKKGLLAAGGAGQPQFTVVPPKEGPRRSEADLLANQGGYVWGDVDSTGCRYSRNWLGNLTDGLARVSLHNGTQALTSVRMQQETETWLNYDITGVTRLRLQVADVRSGYGPYVSIDSLLLCTN